MTDSDDRNGQTCTMCCAGYYQETNIHDDWDGVLHCTNKECNHEVIRYKRKDNPPLKPKSELSLAAYAVLNAWGNVIRANNYEGRVEVPIAAALRAAANDWRVDAEYIDGVEYIRTSTLERIADELEGVKYGTYRCNLETNERS